MVNIALVGATGVVGEQILEQFDTRSFPLGKLRLFASTTSVGEFIDFNDESLPVEELTPGVFAGIDLAIFAAPAEVSRDWCPRAVEAGVVCLDMSAAARLEESRPLLVAGINDARLEGGMFSTPAGLTVQLALLVKALRAVGVFHRLLVTAVAPASAAGCRGIDELKKQAGELLNGRPAQNRVFPAPLAFNCLPSGDSDVEAALVAELCKVFESENFAVQINQLQLPLFYGAGGFVRIEYSSPVEAQQVSDVIAAAEGIDLRESAEFPTPIDSVGSDELLVRLCSSSAEASTTFDLWYAADNVGRCGAGNVVRLAEVLATRLV